MVAGIPWLAAFVGCWQQVCRSWRSARGSALTRQSTPKDSPVTQLWTPPVLPRPRWLFPQRRQRHTPSGWIITQHPESLYLSGAWVYSYLYWQPKLSGGARTHGCPECCMYSFWVPWHRAAGGLSAPAPSTGIWHRDVLVRWNIWQYITPTSNSTKGFRENAPYSLP